MMDGRQNLHFTETLEGWLTTAATKAGCSVLLLVGKSLCSFRQSGSHCHQSQQEWCGIGSGAMWAQLQDWVQRLTPWFWFIISLAAKSKATFPFVLLSGVRIPGPDLGCCFSSGALIVSEVLHHSCAVSPCRCRCVLPAGTSLTYFLCCAPCGGGDQTWQSGFLNFSLPGWFKKEILEVPGGWRMGKAQVSSSSSLWG